MPHAFPADPRAGRRDRPALHPLYVRHHRHAQGHRARQRRPRGRADLDHEAVFGMSRATSSGRRPTWAGSSATPTSSTAPCSTAAPRCSSRASRPHARRRRFWRMIDEHKINALFCAPTALRAIRKEDPEGFCSRNTTCRPARTVPGRRAARPGHLRLGAGRSRSPSSTTGGRPRPAGRSRAIRWA